MSEREQSIGAFLARLATEGIIEHNLDHLLAIEEVLEVAGKEHWGHEELAAAIASICASKPEQWDVIEWRCREWLVRGVKLEGVAGNYMSFHEPRDAESGAARMVGWVVGCLGRIPAVGWIVLVFGVLGLVLGLVYGVMVEPPRGNLGLDIGPARTRVRGSVESGLRTLASKPSVERARELLEPDLEVAEPETQLEPEKTPDPEVAAATEFEDDPKPGPSDFPRVIEPFPRDFADADVPSQLSIDATVEVMPELARIRILAFGVLSGLLLGLGVAWLRLPAENRRSVAERQQDGRLRRRQLAEMPGGIEIPYRVERHPPFAEAAMDDVATKLARIAVQERGVDVDVEATLGRTIEAGGRPTPVLAMQHQARELLVLVDVELGDHPYLSGVEWLLHRFRRGGLRFLRYDFDHRPDARLRSWPEATSTSFDVLARHTDGMPLLLFSRGVALTTEHGEFQQLATWLELSGTWPTRVFIDLDPRVSHERDRQEQRALARLAEHGFVRVPFTAAGLEFAASYLAEPHVRDTVDEPGLRPLSEVHEEIHSWLAAVACVPDPTWDQLEAFRRHFPELERELPDPRYVQRAIEWLETELVLENLGDSPIKDGGKRLALDELADRLIVAQVRRDRERGVPEEQQVIARARRLLIEQLEGARPQQHDGMWRLKYAYQRAMLEPVRADELLREFLGGPYEVELLRMLEAAKWRDTELEGRGLERLDERVQAWTLGHERARMRDLWPRVGWVLASAGVGGLLVGVGLLAASQALVEPIRAPTTVLGQFLKHRVTQDCNFDWLPVPPSEPLGALRDPPRGYECSLIETALADTDAPMQLTWLSSGEFTMGGPGADETPHRVGVSRFAICTTEVSLKQYEIVTGKRPNDCKWGCADDHPVHDVSWEEAAQYLNALTRRENAQGRGDLTLCYDEHTWAWDRSCTGYRLPTEAEWEYAARAGTTTAFSFGDDERDICRYGNVNSNQCEDGFEYLAAVQTERLQTNSWGLHGIHGNVAEWVYDSYDPEFDPSQPASDPLRDVTNVDPNEPSGNAARRVVRGGHFLSSARGARSASRGQDWSVDREWGYGIRCARGPRLPAGAEP